MNCIRLTVRLGEDPRVKNIDKDTKVANFVAFHKHSYQKEGDKDSKVFIEAWKGFGKYVENNLTKGDVVIVSGDFKTPEDGKGQVYPTIIVREPFEAIRVKKFIQPKNAKASNQVSNQGPKANYQKLIEQKTNQNSLAGFTSLEDEIPPFA